MSDHPVASRKHGNERVHVHSKRGFRGQPGHVTRGYEHLLYLMVYLSEEIDFLLLGLLLAGKRTIANWKNLGVDGPWLTFFGSSSYYYYYYPYVCFYMFLLYTDILLSLIIMIHKTKFYEKIHVFV